MRLDPAEFRASPLRVHALLHDVPLEDVWAIRLAGGGAGRTIDDVRAVFIAGVEAAPPLVKWLVRLRGRIGGLLGGDGPRPAWDADSYVQRLTAADRARAKAGAGTPARHAVDDADLAPHARLALARRRPAVGRLAGPEVRQVLGLRLDPRARVHVDQVVGQRGVERRPVLLHHRLDASVVGGQHVALGAHRV